MGAALTFMAVFCFRLDPVSVLPAPVFFAAGFCLLACRLVLFALLYVHYACWFASKGKF